MNVQTEHQRKHSAAVLATLGPLNGQN